MTAPSPEHLLAEIDAQLARAPDHVALRYHRAGLLAQLGRRDEAQAAYLATLALDPAHFGALNDLGSLLHARDFRSAARVAYAEAVRLHPDNPVGRINLANVLAGEGQAEEARAHYLAALEAAPEHPDAHQGLANLLQDLGESDAAEFHRQKSYAGREINTLPYRGAGPPCRVLLLVSAVGGNVPTRFLLDETRFAVSVLAVEAYRPDRRPPPHDLVFNAVGDADLCAPALTLAEAVLTQTGAPVINPPVRVRPTRRALIAQGMAGLPGVRTPRVLQVRRAEAADAVGGLGYPLLLRSPGYHTGRHFEKVEQASDLAGAMAGLPGDALLAIEYLDARDRAGQWRKFRVMMIGGQLFPLHLALSETWKVHYFTAGMAERPDHRALEAAFLQDMPGVLGAKAMAALAAIAERLGLDYAGADFAVNADGEVLLFEANATMVINPPDPDPRWDYRREPVRRALEAVQSLLLSRAKGAV